MDRSALEFLDTRNLDLPSFALNDVTMEEYTKEYSIGMESSTILLN